MIALARKMVTRVYAVLKRRAQARPSTAEDPTAPYELRNTEGRPIDKKQARQMILEKYTRASADPQRHRRDRARRGKNKGVAPAKVEWPSKDATNTTLGKSTQPNPHGILGRLVLHGGRPGTDVQRYTGGNPVENL